MINLDAGTCRTICAREFISLIGRFRKDFAGLKWFSRTKKKAAETEERRRDAGIEVWVNYGTSRKKIVYFKENKGLGARVGKMYLKGNDHR